MTKIVLVIADGALCDVLGDGQDIEVAVIDYDADGLDGVAAIPQLDGTTRDALVSRPKVDVDATRVQQLLGVVDAAEQEFGAADSPSASA